MRTSIVTALAVGIVALIGPFAGAAVFEANFDSGYADQETVYGAGSDWFHATGPGVYTNDMVVHEIGATAPSGSFAMSAATGEALASHPTGIQPDFTGIEATVTMVVGTGGNHGLFGLSPNQDSGTDGDRWRGNVQSAGSMILLYTPGYGVETYLPGGAGAAAYPGVLAGKAVGTPIYFRLSTDTGAGAQTATFEYSEDGANYTILREAAVGADYAASHVVTAFRVTTYGDDIRVSYIPEPASLALLAGGVLVALRRRVR